MAESNEQLKPSTLFDLTDRVAVVTGGGTGIGLMQARGLHAAGARVYLVSRRGEVLDNAVKSWGFAGYLTADITSKAEIEQLVQDFEKKEGRVDILVANAGGPGPTHFGADTSFPDHSMEPGKGLKPKSAQDYKTEVLKDQDFKDWDDLFRLNVSQHMFLAVSFLPLLDLGSKRGLGLPEGKKYTATFITTGSISGTVKQGQMHYAYNASKAAANHLTETIAFEFTQSTTAKVRVNCIAPGVFPSEMTGGGRDEKNRSDISDQMPTMNVPAQRPGKTEDMAMSVQYLAANEFMHGNVLTVDGGFTLTAP
ncbi:NAD(P)-binding protein [Acaromyces ingoldii]|uniref:NAD(P)-binding protein n=1 Tax=Acaromyces ingoldii TaxID=215250 RepID=A0A316YCK7_9BASI|nr:NAD(P)-binding protein [Acaromyces ingoldii]PWN86614.1 NAD(P)-binding protein [Acaromyces ingoldii]